MIRFVALFIDFSLFNDAVGCNPKERKNYVILLLFSSILNFYDSLFTGFGLLIEPLVGLL